MERDLSRYFLTSLSDNDIRGTQNVINSDILDITSKVDHFYSTDNLWQDIINKGVEVMKKDNYENHLVVFEVGAQKVKQSLDAAKEKFHAYCIEPSPKSFNEIRREMAGEIEKNKYLEEFLHIYNVAAGSKSNELLEFRSTGGTGDHVGEFDMWNMKPGAMPEHFTAAKKGEIIRVPSMRLDDIIYDNSVKPDMKDVAGAINTPEIDKVWALKVDTQGFEPHVFAGLAKSIKDQKNTIHYD